MDTRKFSNKQEKDISKKLNGKVQSNSGATPFYRGDVVTKNFIFEAKTKTKPSKSFTVKREWVDKIIKEKFAMNKRHWSIVCNFGPYSGNYYIINEALFQKLHYYLTEIEGE